MPFQYQRRNVLFDGDSANSSTYTSSVHHVGDYERLSIQIDSSNDTITLQGSNDDGFRSSINTWSAITAIGSAGLFTIDAGFSWLRALRNSADSLNVIIFKGKAGA